MDASTGVRSPTERLPSIRQAIELARVELEDPAVTTLAVALLTLLTFAAVRLFGGAPSAVMELGYAPVALAAYTFGRRGGLAAGVAVAAALGPVPALLGFDRVEGPAEWLVRIAAFAGIGTLIGQMLDRSASDAGQARTELADTTERDRASLVALATAAESRDTDAGGHIRRMSMLAERLAKRAGLQGTAADDVAYAAMFHDIGKLRVPERILLKPEPLNPDEWITVRLHPLWGEQALGRDESLALARVVARSHHENWDGTGYPDGLYGDRIPLPARIVRVVDAFDAMTSERPYQQPVSFEAALEELQAGAGKDYDPELVASFAEIIRNDAPLRATLAELREH
ncbi:MAG TPA: HD domain-containing phosphohydrolase [Gaiellaceae bacterium]|nr:HD domain-containing phosphohydrolase [Gaiellaceae bacterium]